LPWLIGRRILPSHSHDVGNQGQQFYGINWLGDVDLEVCCRWTTGTIRTKSAMVFSSGCIK
jgi:hypothetical protein